MKRFFMCLLIHAFSLSCFAACSENPTDSLKDAIPEKSPVIAELSGNLYGIWIDAGMKDNLHFMIKDTVFAEDKGGFAIYSDGTFIRRGNAGWCGTPPISYQNYNGAWQPESGSLLNVKAGYWNGTTNFKIKIVSLTETELICSYIYQD